VRDIAFLHGYVEPVLLVLHEAEPTWVGRYRDRRDTCCLAALSVNAVQKRHPKLWGATELPSDAHSLLAAPVGGALVLCHNVVLYHSQGQVCWLVSSAVGVRCLEDLFSARVFRGLQA
jgi:cleavage and polyadenylation specificity factor subunit 1